MSLHNRFRVSIVMFAALLCLTVNSRPVEALQASESKIEFDGMQGTNPSSPAGGKITATGTYVIVKGETFASVTFKYRLQGSSGWVSVAANTPSGNAWDRTVTNLAAGTYECHAVLRVSRFGVGFVDYSTPDVRTVVVAGP